VVREALTFSARRRSETRCTIVVKSAGQSLFPGLQIFVAVLLFHPVSQDDLLEPGIVVLTECRLRLRGSEKIEVRGRFLLFGIVGQFSFDLL